MEKYKSSLESSSKIWTRDFILIAIINMAIFTGFNMISIAMPLYVTSLGGADFLTGLVTTFATASALIIRAFTGILLDKFGFKAILISGIGIMAASTIAYAVFPIVGVILAIRLLHGIGWGLSSTSTSTIASDVIPKKRFAEGIGYFALTSSLAVAVSPALAIAIVQNIGMLPVIIIASGCTILAIFLSFYEHYPKQTKVAHKQKFSFTNMFDRKALLPSGLMLLVNCAFGSVTTFIALHGQAQGVQNISLYFTVYAIVTIISRPVVGKVIDKVGFYLPSILSLLGVVMTLIIISLSTNITMFCLAGIFGGLGIGTIMGTLQTMAVSSVSTERRGVATSTFLFGVDAGIALGAVISGALAGAFGYSIMFLLMSVFPAIALLIVLLFGKTKIADYSTK